MRQSRVQSGSRVWKAIFAALVAATLPLASACGGSESGDEAAFASRVTFVVPFEAGGGTDTWARFLAPALEDVLPGSPSIRVENLPAGEGIPANNDFYNTAPDDGSQILVGTSSSYNPYLLGEKGVEYDFSKLIPLVANGTGSVIYASKASGIKSIKDLVERSTPVKYGAINQTGADLGALVAFDMLGVDADVTFGFEGRGPIGLAFQRGELDIDRQTTSAYHSTIKPLADKGEVIPLATYGIIDESGEVVRDPNFPDLPTVAEAYEELNGQAPSGAAWEAYKVFAVAGYTFQKTLWAAPDTPASIVDAYGDAVEELKKDEQFMAKLRESAGDYPLMAGNSNRDVIQQSFTVSGEAHNFVETLLADKYDTHLN